MRSLHVGATGMMAQQTHVEVISHNIANMTTTGFKRQRPEFQDLLYQNQRRLGALQADNGNMVPAGVQLGLGVQTAAVYRVHEQGDIVGTEAVLDVAIKGDGYFVLDLPNGEIGYTRSGNFQLDGNGQLVNHDGLPLSPGIIVPEDTVQLTINPEGQVLAKIDGQVQLQDLGQLDMADFINPTGLEAIGDNLFLETPASGAAFVTTAGSDGLGTLLQGYLESSNVNPVQEITALITAQRAYDMNSKVISASDEMMLTVTQLR